MSKYNPPPSESIPFGFCHCGCGDKPYVPIAGKDKGIPMLYCAGHNPASGSRPAEGYKERPNRDARRCDCGGWRNRNAKQCRDCWNKEGKPPVDPFIYIINDKPRRRIPLTQWQYAWVDLKNYERLMRFNYYALWHPVKKGFYAKRNPTIAKNTTIVVPMQYDVMTPEEGEIIDHINSLETLNNCVDNLRSARQEENTQNRVTGRNNTTGRKNVQRWGKRFRVLIRAFGENHKFGPFDTFEEACAAQEEMIKNIHGEFACFG